MDHWIIPKLPTTLATSPTSDRKCFDLGCSFTWRGSSSKTSVVVRRCLQLTQAPVEDQFLLSLVLRTKQVERNNPKAVAERPGVSRFPRLLWLFRNLRSTGMHWAAGAKRCQKCKPTLPFSMPVFSSDSTSLVSLLPNTKYWDPSKARFQNEI